MGNNDCCSNLENCGFVKKHGQSKGLAVQGFIKMYCQNSTKQSECKRRQYKLTHGTPPSDDMMPNGLMVRER